MNALTTEQRMTWQIKYGPNEIVTLTKGDGTQHDVRIEGVSVDVRFGRPLYNVREIWTREAYPADELNLKPRKVSV